MVRLACALCALLLSCKPHGPPAASCPSPPAPPPGDSSQSRAAMRTPGPSRLEDRAAEARAKLAEVRPFRRCFPDDGPLSSPRPLTALLDRAADLYDQATQILLAQKPNAAPEGQPGRKAERRPALPKPAEALYQDSLLCAEEAARMEPRSVEAHHSRGLALQEILQLDAARDAITRALAIDPEDPETLAGAADLYINRLAPSLDHTETGLEYARRGSRRARRSKDKALIGRLALLEGQALNDLGHAREALSRLDASLNAEDSVQARYERAVALFDLCRFEDARRSFEDVSARSPGDAWAHHHLGLALEGLGRVEEAEREFDLARRAAPQDFPAPLRVNPEEFRALVDKEAQALPEKLRKDLAQVALETADLPDIADLTAEEPPLSPTILGLFRGTPLAESGPGGARPGGTSAPAAGTALGLGEGPRTIVLYRKNLLRAVGSKDELITQIRTTLLHELGHLRGEDDEVLRARGLE